MRSLESAMLVTAVSNISENECREHGYPEVNCGEEVNEVFVVGVGNEIEPHPDKEKRHTRNKKNGDLHASNYAQRHGKVMSGNPVPNPPCRKQGKQEGHKPDCEKVRCEDDRVHATSLGSAH
jgi:hypothetical protein